MLRKSKGLLADFKDHSADERKWSSEGVLSISQARYNLNDGGRSRTPIQRGCKVLCKRCALIGAQVHTIRVIKGSEDNLEISIGITWRSPVLSRGELMRGCRDSLSLLFLPRELSIRRWRGVRNIWSGTGTLAVLPLNCSESGGYTIIPWCPHGNVITVAELCKKCGVINCQHPCEAIKTEFVEAGQEFLSKDR